MRLGIIGGGRAAWAFGSTWRRLGWPLSGIALRSAGPIAGLLAVKRAGIAELASDSDLLLVAVPDTAIVEVVESCPATAAVIFHASGALPALRGGFSLHPLKVLPPVGEPSDLAGALLVFQGAHRQTAKRIAEAAGARFAEISAEEKLLYHAAAVLGSNDVAALLDIAEALIGVPDARNELAGLAKSAIENWLAHTDARRFTGPAARGDRELLARHSEALRNRPQVAEIYRLLAEWILAGNK